MRFIRQPVRLFSIGTRLCNDGSLGSGAGKGGGGGGSIRDAGGAFGKMQVAKEEEYFYKQRLEQLEKIKNGDTDAADLLQQDIKSLEEHLQKQKDKLRQM